VRKLQRAHKRFNGQKVLNVKDIGHKCDDVLDRRRYPHSGRCGDRLRDVAAIGRLDGDFSAVPNHDVCNVLGPEFRPVHRERDSQLDPQGLTAVRGIWRRACL
jgi:hypothetical protein